jgi:hypothetical protein
MVSSMAPKALPRLDLVHVLVDARIGKQTHHGLVQPQSASDKVAATLAFLG